MVPEDYRTFSYTEFILLLIFMIVYYINHLDKLPSRDLGGGMKYIKFWLLVITIVGFHYRILLL
jgi:hypothetical protein